MREIYHLSEQLKLFEDHLGELGSGAVGCPDCLWKHVNALVGYAHEVATLSEQEEMKSFYQRVADEARNWRKAIFEVEANPEVLERKTAPASKKGNPDGWPIGLTLPEAPKPYYVYWIKTEKDRYVGPYGKKKWATDVVLKGHEVVRRKRGWRPDNLGNPGIPEYCEFAHEEVKPKGYFDPKSFRTLCPESPTGLCKDLPPKLACATRVIIGCQKGKFVKGRCRVGTEAHVVYHQKP